MPGPQVQDDPHVASGRDLRIPTCIKGSQAPPTDYETMECVICLEPTHQSVGLPCNCTAAYCLGCWEHALAQSLLSCGQARCPTCRAAVRVDFDAETGNLVYSRESDEAPGIPDEAIAHSHDVLALHETELLYDRYGASLEAVRPPLDDEALEEIFRTHFLAAPPSPPPPPPMTLADVWDGILGLGLLGAVALTCWSVSPRVHRWSTWCWWHWQFLLYDLSSWRR
mmetsp:Transcript_68017/g.127022  ORF Transcript_68017/g.127022 Transcript_68017/m.127022 type:complete len:225 (-) Transcript_68017:202-876(-)